MRERERESRYRYEGRQREREGGSEPFAAGLELRGCKMIFDMGIERGNVFFMLCRYNASD